MRLLLAVMLTALIAVATPRSASAQPQVSVPLIYLEADPDKLVETAFSIPYGQLLIAEFATVLAASADASCLKSNGIDKSGLEQRARALTLRHGAEIVRRYAAAVDRAKFKTNLSTSMGAGAEAELAKLRTDKDVRALIELGAPMQDAAIVNAVIETVDRNIVLLKFKLSRRFHPLATGDMKLLDADPSDSVLEKLEQLIKASSSAAVDRYLELMVAVQEALNQSTDTRALLGTRVVDLTPGLDKDLAAVCISRQ